MVKPIRGTIYEDTGAILAARVTNLAGVNITQASLAAINYLVKDTTTGTTIANGTLSIGAVVFDTLQTDSFWTTHQDGDSTGYNFRYDSPKTWYPTGGRSYQIDIVFDPNMGEDFARQFIITTIPLDIS